MFTCDCESICKKREALAKKEHLGDAKGIKLFIRKMTWQPWIRNSNVCHGGCHIWNDIHREQFANFIEKNAEWIINMK